MKNTNFSSTKKICLMHRKTVFCFVSHFTCVNAMFIFILSSPNKMSHCALLINSFTLLIKAQLFSEIFAKHYEDR